MSSLLFNTVLQYSLKEGIQRWHKKKGMGILTAPCSGKSVAASASHWWQTRDESRCPQRQVHDALLQAWYFSISHHFLKKARASQQQPMTDTCSRTSFFFFFLELLQRSAGPTQWPAGAFGCGRHCIVAVGSAHWRRKSAPLRESRHVCSM